MTDTPTYCPLCGTKEPHKCESKPLPKEKAPSKSVAPGPTDLRAAEIALEWNDIK